VPSIRSVCVYCASSSVVDGVYFDAAEQVGRTIADRCGTLVFGGNGVGLMQRVADSVKDAGGTVIGVTPRLMDEQGITYQRCDELIVTDDMRQRKALMEQRADAFLTLPGGFGTLEELFETLTHQQLGYHAKPIALLNVAGFYDPLVELFEHIYRSRFAREKQRRSYRVASDAAEAIDYFEGFEPAADGDKW